VGQVQENCGSGRAHRPDPTIVQIKEDEMSEQLAGTATPIVQLDMIASQGRPEWDGSRLTFRAGLLSGKTVTLSLDALRSVYLFFPKQFKWQIVQSSQIYRYINLDSLSEQELTDVQSLPVQYRSMLGTFQFVLTGMDGHVAKVSWKSLVQAGIDPIAEFLRYRAARQEARARWLQQSPSIVLGASGLSMNVAGISSGRGRFIPWYALGNVRLQETHSLVNFCTFTLSPAQGSGLKTITAAASPRDVESYLAEMHFWTEYSKGGPSVGAAPVEGVAPPPPPAMAGNGLARTSLITGILGWTLLPFIGTIVAIVTGHLALRAIGKGIGVGSDRRRAVIGLVLGYAQVALVVLILVLPLLSH
jgi:hypothetical protein